MTIDDVDGVVPFESVDNFDSVSEFEAKKKKKKLKLKAPRYRFNIEYRMSNTMKRTNIDNIVFFANIRPLLRGVYRGSDYSLQV